MAINRLASQCPPVQVVSATLRKRIDAFNAVSGTAPSARRLVYGDLGSDFIGKINENGLLLDLCTRYGSSAIRAIGTGLGITPVGTTITVAAGHALIEGICELATDASAIPVSDGWNYVYLVQAVGGTGTVTVVPASLVAPLNAAFIGAVNVVGGVGTVDTSCVVYDRGEIRWRETADTGVPSDTPGTTCALWTKTTVGHYLWTGSSYLRIDTNLSAGETPTGTVNGSNTAFTLAHTPLVGTVAVYLGASATTLYRYAPSAYSVTGSTLTFSVAPATGSVIVVDYRY